MNSAGEEHGDALPSVLAVVDPQRRKLLIPTPALRPTRALASRPSPPSLCLLYQAGRCRQGSRCYQVHAAREVVGRLRAEAERLVSCCETHGDPFRPRDGEGQGEGYVRVGRVRLPFSRLAYTAALERLLRTGLEEVIVAPQALCTLHGQSEGCRFGADCKFLHVCRRLLLDPAFAAELTPPADTLASGETEPPRGPSAASENSSCVTPNSPFTMVRTALPLGPAFSTAQKESSTTVGVPSSNSNNNNVYNTSSNNSSGTNPQGHPCSNYYYSSNTNNCSSSSGPPLPQRPMQMNLSSGTFPLPHFSTLSSSNDNSTTFHNSFNQGGLSLSRRTSHGVSLQSSSFLPTPSGPLGDPSVQVFYSFGNLSASTNQRHSLPSNQGSHPNLPNNNNNNNNNTNLMPYSPAETGGRGLSFSGVSLRQDSYPAEPFGRSWGTGGEYSLVDTATGSSLPYLLPAPPPPPPSAPPPQYVLSHVNPDGSVSLVPVNVILRPSPQ